jgi:MFS family permease
MTTESLMVLTPISTPIHFGISPKIVAWFLSFTAFIVFPITYFISKLEKKYTERQIIFTLLVLCMCSCLLILNFPFEEVSLFRFMTFYTVLFVSCNILESVDSALLAKIFPSNLNLGVCNSGFTIILSTTGGKFIGSFLITIIGWFVKEEAVYDLIIAFYLIIYVVLNLFVYRNYAELRVKAIARILQKNE